MANANAGPASQGEGDRTRRYRTRIARWDGHGRPRRRRRAGTQARAHQVPGDGVDLLHGGKRIVDLGVKNEPQKLIHLVEGRCADRPVPARRVRTTGHYR